MMRTLVGIVLSALLIGGCAALPPRAREVATERWNLARARFKAQLAADHLEAGRVAAAAGELAEATELAPESREWEPLEARLALARGDIALAESILEAIAPEHQHSAEVAHLLGVVREQQQRWSDALAEHRRAMRLAPDDVSYVVVASHTALQMGRVDDALELLKAAEERFSWSPAYQGALAECYEQLGRWPECAAAWQRVVDEDPKDRQACERLAVALSRADRCDDAIILLSRVLETASGPSTAALRVRLVECLLAAGPRREAVREARELTHLTPGDARAHRLFAQACAAAGDERTALASAHRALTLDPRDVPTLELVATLAWRTRDQALLAAALEQLAAADPANAVAAALRAHAGAPEP
jgi:tetratricopeptide (TPR) repeat protein